MIREVSNSLKRFNLIHMVIGIFNHALPAGQKTITAHVEPFYLVSLLI